MSESTIFEGINRLESFLKRSTSGGYLFASSKNWATTLLANRDLVERAAAYQKNVYIFNIEETSDFSLPEQFRQFIAVHQPVHGLIVNNIDRILLTAGNDILLQLNFAREFLQELGIPIIFWVNQQHLSLVANQAADLFSQRALTTVYMDGEAEGETYSFFFDSIQGFQDAEAINLKIALLEKQLLEAKNAGFPEEQIARNIALPLITGYTSSKEYDKAKGLFAEFGAYYPVDENQLHLKGIWALETGEIDAGIAHLAQAIELFQQNKSRDNIQLLDLYHRLANAFIDKRDGESALKYAKWGLAYAEEKGISSSKILTQFYEKTGNAYWLKEAYDQALINYQKTLELRQAYLPQDDPRIGVSLNNIAIANANLGDVKNALNYFLEAIDIFKKNRPLYDHHLTEVFNNMGIIYEGINQPQNAQLYYQKAEALKNA